MHCNRCGTEHGKVELPFTCTTLRCGYVLTEETRKGISLYDLLRLQIQWKEDLQVCDLLDSIANNEKRMAKGLPPKSLLATGNTPKGED